MSVLLIRRATREGDPWSGHMSFPGGRKSEEDLNLLETAKRELSEEIGINISEEVTYIGRLSDVVTRAHEKLVPMVVTPFVFRLEKEPKWKLNHEVEEIVWVPIEFLANPKNRSHMHWKFAWKDWKLPCYLYENRRIWGLTLIMLEEFISLAVDGHIDFLGWLKKLTVRTW